MLVIALGNQYEMNRKLSDDYLLGFSAFKAAFSLLYLFSLVDFLVLVNPV